MGSCKVTCDTAVKKVFTQTRNDANPVRLDMYNVGSLHYHIRTDAGEIIDPTYQQFFNFGPDHPGEVFFGTGDELVAEIERLRNTVGFRERFSGFEKKSSQEIYDFLWGNGKLYRSGDDLNYYEDIGETLFD